MEKQNFLHSLALLCYREHEDLKDQELMHELPILNSSIYPPIIHMECFDQSSYSVDQPPPGYHLQGGAPLSSAARQHATRQEQKSMTQCPDCDSNESSHRELRAWYSTDSSYTIARAHNLQLHVTKQDRSRRELASSESLPLHPTDVSDSRLRPLDGRDSAYASEDSLLRLHEIPRFMPEILPLSYYFESEVKVMIYSDETRGLPRAKRGLSESLPLHLKWDDNDSDEGENVTIKEVRDITDELLEETSGNRIIKTDLQKPIDPNLVCPTCNKQFRIGKIQKLRRHAKKCVS